MSVKNDLNELIRRWIEDVKDIPACEAYLDEYTSTDGWGGCETCGPGYTKSFDIWYTIPGDSSRHYLTVEGDPLTWLADTLLPFEETL